jgi:hypothetical protein
MKVWIDSLLTSVGSPLKKEYLLTPSLVVDFRKNQKNKWYTNESIHIETDNVYKNEGKNKDKDKTIKELCRKIVDTMNSGEQVLLVCQDGLTVCGYIAIICRWWYLYEHKQINKDFDYIKEVRDANDFTSAKSKEQREQMLIVKEYALGILRWKSFTSAERPLKKIRPDNHHL